MLAGSRVAGGGGDAAGPTAAVTPSAAVVGAEEIEVMLEGIPQDGMALGSPNAR